MGIYDPSSNTWTTGPSLPGAARSRLGAVLGPDKRIYAMGGGNPPTSAVNVLDPAGGVWADGPSLVMADQNFGTAVAPDGRIFIFSPVRVQVGDSPPMAPSTCEYSRRLLLQTPRRLRQALRSPAPARSRSWPSALQL